ncbi:MAG: hypothetical protein LBP32_07360 [Spirochaetaceae bacterium]|jgi:hypothetical protein|nr:hypothetical protein [Spirochaetaceae bacterium]
MLNQGTRKTITTLLIGGFILMAAGCGRGVFIEDPVEPVLPEPDDSIPTGLKAEVLPISIYVTWNPVPEAELYRVYRASNTLSPYDDWVWTVAAEGASTVYNDINIDLTAPQRYYYQVSALRDGAEGERSHYNSALAPAAVITGLPHSVSTTGAISAADPFVYYWFEKDAAGSTQEITWTPTAPPPFFPVPDIWIRVFWVHRGGDELLSDNREPAAAISGSYTIPARVNSGRLLVTVEGMDPGDTGPYTIKYTP